MILPDKMGLSVFPRITDNIPIHCNVPMERVANSFLLFRRRRTKATIPCWSPTTYEPGTTRGNRNVKTVTALVLDYDDGTTMEMASDAWWMWFHIGHTTWSHTPNHHRFRIILPLREPVPAEQWPLAWAAGLEAWKENTVGVGGSPDTTCKDAARVFYLPAHRESQERHAWVTENRYPLNLMPREVGHPWWDKLRARLNTPKAQPMPPSSVSYGDVQNELKNRLAQCPDMRARWAMEMGANVSDGVARDAGCPQCKRRSVWWWIDPSQRRSAACNHKNSCGWYGQLWLLIR